MLKALGKASSYISEYTPQLLEVVPRQLQRDRIGVNAPLPFVGVDIWNAYELSWLDNKGKPEIAVVELVVPCASHYLIESKSLKLYFNSYNNSRFDSAEQVRHVVIGDLSSAIGAPVKVRFFTPQEFRELPLGDFSGTCIDHLDVACDVFLPMSKLLTIEKECVEETIYSDLLKSNCLVTGQPDWSSVQFSYEGKKINHKSLLQYIVSYRNESSFSESCIERIFMDILRECEPNWLRITARYTKRGGIDINPIRATDGVLEVSNKRLYRQ